MKQLHLWLTDPYIYRIYIHTIYMYNIIAHLNWFITNTQYSSILHTLYHFNYTEVKPVKTGFFLVSDFTNKIKYNEPKKEYKVGETFNLDAKYNDKELTFISENPSIVEVDKETGERLA